MSSPETHELALIAGQVGRIVEALEAMNAPGCQATASHAVPPLRQPTATRNPLDAAIQAASLGDELQRDASNITRNLKDLIEILQVFTRGLNSGEPSRMTTATLRESIDVALLEVRSSAQSMTSNLDVLAEMITSITVPIVITLGDEEE